MAPADTPSPGPDLSQALHLLQHGQPAEAAAVCQTILAQQPDEADALYLLGAIALQGGDPAAAASLLHRAVTLLPELIDARHHLAAALRRLGRPLEALAALDGLLTLRPDHAEAHVSRGSLLRELGRLEDSLAALDHAIALIPSAEAYVHRGMALRLAGDAAAAVTAYDQAIALQPNRAEAHLNRGNALAELGRHAEALAACAEAVRLRPTHADNHVALGNALLQLGRAQEALDSYDRAIALRPDQVAAHGNRGNALRRLQRPDEALRSYDAALALHPGDAGLLFSRGELLRHEGAADAALRSLRAAVLADPLHGSARLAACMAELPILYVSEAEIADRRRGYHTALLALDEGARDADVARSLAGAIGAPPFYLPYQGGNDVALQSLYGRMACRCLDASLPPVRLATPPASGARIRLGIVSGYFRSHTVFKLFLQGWLSEIDRDRFELYGFHTGAHDAITDGAGAACDRFVQGLPSKTAWREAIAACAPHVLLYPEIGMDAVCGWLAAQRLAPLQCVTWGHPETTGMPTIDCFLTSELMEPPDGDQHYTEQLVRLPRLGLHYTPDAPVPPLNRATLGIEPGMPIFWSGQSLYKYLPQYDALFPRIARMVGECRFLFVSTVSAGVTALFQQRLARSFAECGLDASRYCQVLPRMEQETFVAMAGLADVVLDPPGWSGGRTTLDSLAQNPAIVTWPGPFMRGRHTAAILRQIGCEATIAASLDDYVAIAARLALDAGWRREVRTAIAVNRERAYCDAGYMRALEAFLIARAGA